MPLCLLCNKVLSYGSIKPSKLQDHLRRCHPDKTEKDFKNFQTLKEKLEKRPTPDKMFASTGRRNDDGFAGVLQYFTTDSKIWKTSYYRGKNNFASCQRSLKNCFTQACIIEKSWHPCIVKTCELKPKTIEFSKMSGWSAVFQNSLVGAKHCTPRKFQREIEGIRGNFFDFSIQNQKFDVSKLRHLTIQKSDILLFFIVFGLLGALLQCEFNWSLTADLLN